MACRAWLLALTLTCWGCGDAGDQPPGETGSGGGGGVADAGCAPGTLLLEDGSCLDAGVQRNGCPAGRVASNGACVDPGVPAGACANGFDPQQGECHASLPAQPCASGQMALPGEVSCRDVAPCGAAPWGDVVIELDTQFVDQGFGGVSDGSQSAPWTGIQQAIDAATPGATVAIAAGNYAEDVAVSAPVTLWARCPSLVTLAGTATLTGDATLRGLAIDAALVGVVVDAAAVSIDACRIHDSGDAGIVVDASNGAASVAMSASLIESATRAGIEALGATVHIEDSVVRGTAQLAAGTAGRGVTAQPANGPASVVVQRSVIDGNHEAGLFVGGSTLSVDASVIQNTQVSAALGIALAIAAQQDTMPADLSVTRTDLADNQGASILVLGSPALIEHTTVRDSQPDATGSGWGISIQAHPVTATRADATIRASAIVRSRGVGVATFGSDLWLESSAVRDVSAGAANTAHGVNVGIDPTTQLRAVATLIASAMERSGSVGVHVDGSDVSLDGVLVRDTQPGGTDGSGHGIELHPRDGQLSQLAAMSSVIESSHRAGMLVSAASATLEASVIRDTSPSPTDLRFGNAVIAQPASDMLMTPSMFSCDGCLIERNADIAVLGLYGSMLTLDHTLVRDTVVSAVDQLHGDGVVVVSGSSAFVNHSAIMNNARAGIAAFAALVSLSDTELSCNGFDLAGELYEGVSSTFEDGGNNRCGCPADDVCKLVSAGLAPPAAQP